MREYRLIHRDRRTRRLSRWLGARRSLPGRATGGARLLQALGLAGVGKSPLPRRPSPARFIRAARLVVPPDRSLLETAAPPRAAEADARREPIAHDVEAEIPAMTSPRLEERADIDDSNRTAPDGEDDHAGGGIARPVDGETAAGPGQLGVPGLPQLGVEERPAGAPPGRDARQTLPSPDRQRFGDAEGLPGPPPRPLLEAEPGREDRRDVVPERQAATTPHEDPHPLPQAASRSDDAPGDDEPPQATAQAGVPAGLPPRDARDGQAGPDDASQGAHALGAAGDAPALSPIRRTADSSVSSSTPGDAPVRAASEEERPSPLSARAESAREPVDEPPDEAGRDRPALEAAAESPSDEAGRVDVVAPSPPVEIVGPARRSRPRPVRPEQMRPASPGRRHGAVERPAPAAEVAAHPSTPEPAAGEPGDVAPAAVIEEGPIDPATLFIPGEADRAPESWFARLIQVAEQEQAAAEQGDAPPPAAPESAIPVQPAARAVPVPRRTGHQASPEPAPPPIPEPARRFLRPLVGIDPASVRVHRGAAAEQVTGAFGADALASGDDVVLGTTEPADAPESLGLLAHELTHVARRREPRFVPPVARLPHRPAETFAARTDPVATAHRSEDVSGPETTDEESLARRVEARVVRAATALTEDRTREQVPANPEGGELSRRSPSPDAGRGDSGEGRATSPLLPALGEGGEARDPAPSPDPAATEGAPSFAVPPVRSRVARTDWGGLPAPWEPLPEWPGASAAAPESPARSSGAASSSPPVHLASRTRPVEPEADLDGVPGPVEEPHDAEEPDLDALARQVYAVLRRRLAAERRRAG